MEQKTELIRQLKSVLTEGGEGTTLGDTIQGDDTQTRFIFCVAELTKKSGRTTCGEGGSGDKTTAKKSYHLFRGR